uniref:Uncharacterized protein n=1 Tax=Romanomermis culicivorax TaxID=13658 RepID=A0A915HY46_ROMCU
MDDQRRKHLHRNGAPNKEQNVIIRLLDESEGPLVQVPACELQALEDPLGDPAKKNALKQATAVSNDVAAPVDLLYGGACVVPSSNAFMRTAASSAVSTTTATEQYHQAQTQTGAVIHQLQPTQQSAAATSALNNNRSPSMLQNKSQQTLGLTGQQIANQHGQPQRSYTSSGVQSSADNAKETTVNPSTITLPSTQAGMNYNNSVNRTVTTSDEILTAVCTATGKPQISSSTIFNAATNPSYQALAAAMPYIYPPAEQNYLNALQFLQGPTAGYPFSALGTLPFDIASLTLRDTQQPASNDGKQFGANRTDVSMSGAGAANTSINAPPGLGPATVQNAEQQAAQLLTPAAAAAAAYTHPYQLMQAAPFYAPFVVPNVTNSSASTVNTVNQFNKNFASAQPMFYGSGDMQMAQDYTKSLYGINVTGQPLSQTKQGSTGSNMSINANDTASKGYSNTLKMLDGKNFQQNTATPPPGIGNVNFPPGAAAAFHSSSVNAAAAAAAAAYGPYAQFLPHQINMLPPNIAAQAQTVNPNDVLNNAGQRGTAGGNKAGPNVYSATKNNAYWTN